MIGLLDYGAGNLFSVRNALDRIGQAAKLVAAPPDLEGVDRLILPGVGHFGPAAQTLHTSGLFGALRSWAAAGRPLLGICLGMQLLFDGSEEDVGRSRGLGLLPGRVVHLNGPRRLHMGWNEVVSTGIPAIVSDGFYYFVHGFAPRAENNSDILADTRFGESTFPAAAGRGSILGLQFHPEKSGVLGLDFLTGWAKGRFTGTTKCPPGQTSPKIGRCGGEGPAIRIIACLDMDDGRVVKGVRFQNLRDAGDPAELARAYDAQGADELCFLDVGASWKSRTTLLDVVRRVAREVFIPLTVGGGLRSIEDIRDALNAGADKVSFGTAAVENLGLLTAAAERFGRQCVVASIDAKQTTTGWTVTTHGGRRDRGMDAVDWAVRVEEAGAGEILLNSIDRDGTGTGYDLELLRRVHEAVRIPVIASGGGDEPGQLIEAVEQGKADAVLLASSLHDGRRIVADYKRRLRGQGVRLR